MEIDTDLLLKKIALQQMQIWKLEEAVAKLTQQLGKEGKNGVPAAIAARMEAAGPEQ